MIQKLAMCCIVAVVLSAVVGCESDTDKYGQISGAFAPPGSGQGRIYFYRDTSSVDFLVQPEIRLDQRRVGASIPGAFFYLDVPAGNYVCEIPTMGDSDSHGYSHTLAFAVKANETRYIRTFAHYGAMLESKEAAMTTLADCSYTRNVPW